MQENTLFSFPVKVLLAQLTLFFSYRLSSPNPRTYIGSGKVSEIKSAIRAFDVETVIFDDELSPGYFSAIFFLLHYYSCKDIAVIFCNFLFCNFNFFLQCFWSYAVFYPLWLLVIGYFLF